MKDAKLTDFDLVGAHDTTGGTRTGALGTVVYAAPECLDKPQEATARADVFGLGMTAIFCLAERELSLSTFRNPEETIEGLDCSAHVKAVLRRAVTWEPEQRFADAGAMVEALRGAAEDIVASAASAGPATDRRSSPPTRQELAVAAAESRERGRVGGRVSSRWVLRVALLIVLTSLVVAAALYGVLR